ncbi:MAG: hypothetical protein ACUVQP_09090 [Bacteroidales bacterium]
MKELIFAVGLALTSNCDKNSRGGKIKTFVSLDALNEARNFITNIETYHKYPRFISLDHIKASDTK